MNTNDAQIRIYRRVTPISHPGSTEGAGWALNVLITGAAAVAAAVAAAALLPCRAAGFFFFCVCVFYFFFFFRLALGPPLEGQAVKFVGW